MRIRLLGVVQALAVGWLSALVLAVLTPSSARANVEDSFGLGSRAVAMGGAFCAVADDFSAVYYNPAGLSQFVDYGPLDAERTGVDIHVGFMWAQPSLWIKRGEVTGDHLEFSEEVDPAHDMLSTSGVTLGFNFDLSKIAGIDGLHFAFALYLPVTRYFRWDILNSSDLQWPMYHDRTQRISILPAISYRIIDMVSLGVGLRIGVSVETNTIASARLDDDPNSGETAIVADLGEDVRIVGEVSPIVGVHVKPTSWLSFGLVWRHEMYVDDWGYNDIDTSAVMGDAIPAISYTHHFAHYFIPMQVSLGTAVKPFDEMLISADVTWNDWSSYLDSQHDNHGTDIVEDTFIPRVGVQVRILESTSILAGYAFEKSPFDNQQTYRNFVDNDKHIITLGSQTDLAVLLGPGLLPIKVSWHAQLHVLTEKREVKDWRNFQGEDELLANPGYPGYLSGGWALNIGISLDCVF